MRTDKIYLGRIMNPIYKTLLEQVKSSTDDNNILVAFEEVFNTNPESIEKSLTLVELYGSKNKLDLQSISSITNTIRDALSVEELKKKVFLISLNGMSIDSRFINVPALTDIIQTVGFNPQNGKYFNHINNQSYVKDKDLSRYIIKVFDYNLITDSVKGYHKDIEEYIQNVISFVINSIRDNNQYTSKKYVSDPFVEKSVSFKNQVVTITYNDLFPVVPTYYGNDNIIQDYKSHFSELDTLLEFILAARFGADKKKAYLWLRAESDWGKSFLFQGILGKLKLSTTITESELKKSYSGSASAFNADMFIHSWILFVDEFKSAVSEIKNITHELSFSPKFQGQVTVPLFAKIFSSAENVKSLNNGGMVERQFSNRFMFWSEQGNLTKRSLFSENQMLYINVITTYVYEYLKRRSDEYISFGEIEASNEANRVLNKIIQSKKTHTETVEDVLSRYIKEFKELFSNENSDTFYELRDYMFIYNGDTYITNKGKFVNVFLDRYFDDNEQRVIKHKENDAILDIQDSKRQSIRVNGTIKSGYLWISHKPKVDNIDDFLDVA